MVSRKTYEAKTVKAARSVLLELTHLLAEYRDDIVLVGGWVPELIIPHKGEIHVGSIDVDLALNHKKLKEAGYRTIRSLLLDRHYKEGDQPFIFYREVKFGDGSKIDVQVDFLAGEYEGTGKSHRHQKVQEMFARKARGCDLAFENSVEIEVAGELPGGGKDSAVVKVSSIVPFLVMKAVALNDRLKEKDSWDIYYCINNYPGGIPALAKECEPHLGHKIVKEGLNIIAEKFATMDHIGCRFVSDFEELTDRDEIQRLKRDVFEKIDRLLKALRIRK